MVMKENREKCPSCRTLSSLAIFLSRTAVKATAGRRERKKRETAIEERNPGTLPTRSFPSFTRFFLFLFSFSCSVENWWGRGKKEGGVWDKRQMLGRGELWTTTTV